MHQISHKGSNASQAILQQLWIHLLFLYLFLLGSDLLKGRHIIWLNTQLFSLAVYSLWHITLQQLHIVPPSYSVLCSFMPIGAVKSKTKDQISINCNGLQIKDVAQIIAKGNGCFLTQLLLTLSRFCKIKTLKVVLSCQSIARTVSLSGVLFSIPESTDESLKKDKKQFLQLIWSYEKPGFILDSHLPSNF